MSCFRGDDIYNISCVFVSRIGDDYDSEERRDESFPITWNQLFSTIAPYLINEASEPVIRSSLVTYLRSIASAHFSQLPEYLEMELFEFKFTHDIFHTYLIQFRALGLIKESKKQRSIKDTATYWTLSPLGDMKMVQLRALKK